MTTYFFINQLLCCVKWHILAKKHKLFVIEDSAHAPLSEYKGNKVGTLGDIGTFSFFSNKNIAIGEGGMIITNNKKLHEKFKLIRSHGMTSLSYQRFKGHATKYDIKSLGYNYINESQNTAYNLFLK